MKSQDLSNESAVLANSQIKNKQPGQQNDKQLIQAIELLDWEIVRQFLGSQFFNNKDFNIEKFVKENASFLKYLLTNIA